MTRMLALAALAWGASARAQTYTNEVATYDVPIATACPTETDLADVYADGRQFNIVVGWLSVRIHNSASARRAYTVRLRRGGTSCANAAPLYDSNAPAQMSVAAGEEQTVSETVFDATDGQIEAYRTCACTSSTAGTQTAEFTTAVIFGEP